jgi:ribonuclease E
VRRTTSIPATGRGNRRAAADHQTSPDVPFRRTPCGGSPSPTRVPARPPVISIGARERMRRRALVADFDSTPTDTDADTDTDALAGAAGQDDDVSTVPAVSEDSSVPEDEPATEDDAQQDVAAQPDAELEAELEAKAATEPAAEPDHEHELPRFAAPFSSPEPTAVVARPRRRATRSVIAADPESVEASAPASVAPAFVSFVAPAETDAPPAPRRRSRRPAESPEPDDLDDVAVDTEEDAAAAPARTRRSRSRRRPVEPADVSPEDVEEIDTEDTDDDTEDRDEDREEGTPGSRRRRRGRRGRGRGRTGEDAGDEDSSEETGDAESDDDEDADSAEDAADTDTDADESETGSSTRRRRRRRRRSSSGASGESSDEADDDDRPERAGRNGRTTSDDDVRGVAGSTRLEAKRQRRRDGRDTGRRRAPILTEAEFLARREAVDRKMVIRQRGERTQIAVLEDDVLVEHYVTQASATSFAGNVYLGRVQNVLPSMEAAFVDIGKGRNAVLYAGEVNWDAAGLSGKSRSIETALKSGDKVLVQVTKDPIGHKGARLTQQINLPGRFLVYVPGGSMTGISRKLPDTERQRLKDILKKIVPEDAGVIIRTAAEGASEEELTRDVNRLTAQWEVIQKKAESTSNAPTLLYGEPDLAIRVIRDVFNEDFKELVVQGDDAWDTVEAYVAHVSPELTGRLSRYTGEGDVFHDLRIDEQLAKALDRKVWLPSGGSLVIDRTEAMTVVDVNTGKFVGSGGNLEQTVTRNNMEAAEEIVRQLRLRDIGGIIVIDFIDMVLESNRDLVLRRLTECLGRDRTKHQVAEVTSLGLVQMTRKRVGQGLLEVFSEPCEHCRGRGVIVSTDPVDEKRRSANSGGGNSGGGNSGGGNSGGGNSGGGNSGGGNSGGGNGAGNRRDRSGGRDAKDSGRDQAKDAGRDQAKDESPAPQAETSDVPSEGEAAEGSRSGGRRNRGRRNRGQSGEDRVAEDAAVLAAAEFDADPAIDTDRAEADRVEADAPAGAEETPVVDGSIEVPPAAEEPATVVDETPAEPTSEPTSEAVAVEVAPVAVGAPVGRPRRRRAASRPAGPPVS